MKADIAVAADEIEESPPVDILLLGLGGGGGRQLANVAEILNGITSERATCRYLAIDTDTEDLKALPDVITKCQIGRRRRRGRGCAGKAKFGQMAFEEDRQAVTELIAKPHYAVVLGSLGGGTTSGSIAEVVNLLKNLEPSDGLFEGVTDADEILERKCAVQVMVTLPFQFEGPEFDRQAKTTLGILDGLGVPISVVNNDKLLAKSMLDHPIDELFRALDLLVAQVLARIINGLSQRSDRNNLDWSDVARSLRASGRMYCNVGYACGETPVTKALDEASKNSFQETNLSQSTNGLFFVQVQNATGNDLLELDNWIRANRAHPDAVWRYALSTKLKLLPFEQQREDSDNIRVVVVAVGMGYELAQPAVAKSVEVEQSQRSPASLSGNNGGAEVDWTKPIPVRVGANSPANSNIGSNGHAPTREIAPPRTVSKTQPPPSQPIVRVEQPRQSATLPKHIGSVDDNGVVRRTDDSKTVKTIVLTRAEEMPGVRAESIHYTAPGLEKPSFRKRWFAGGGRKIANGNSGA